MKWINRIKHICLKLNLFQDKYIYIICTWIFKINIYILYVHGLSLLGGITNNLNLGLV